MSDDLALHQLTHGHAQTKHVALQGQLEVIPGLVPAFQAVLHRVLRGSLMNQTPLTKAHGIVGTAEFLVLCCADA